MATIDLGSESSRSRDDELSETMSQFLVEEDTPEGLQLKAEFTSPHPDALVPDDSRVST